MNLDEAYPFKLGNFKTLKESIINDNPMLHERLPKDLLRTLKWALNKTPTYRISIDKLLEVFLRKFKVGLKEEEVMSEHYPSPFVSVNNIDLSTLPKAFLSEKDPRLNLYTEGILNGLQFNEQYFRKIPSPDSREDLEKRIKDLEEKLERSMKQQADLETEIKKLIDHNVAVGDIVMQIFQPNRNDVCELQKELVDSGLISFNVPVAHLPTESTLAHLPVESDAARLPEVAPESVAALEFVVNYLPAIPVTPQIRFQIVNVDLGEVMPYSCTECGKRFRSLGQKNKHLPVHTNERTFICKSCPKSYKRCQALYKHLRNKHSVLPRHYLPFVLFIFYFTGQKDGGKILHIIISYLYQLKDF